MRIVAWNCNMRFRDKIDKVLSLNADIAIISECEAPVKGGFAHNVIWVGDNANKGLAVFSLSGKKIEVAPQYNDAFKYVVPVICGEYLIFAVWACDIDKYRYVEQVYQAMLYYKNSLRHKKIIIAGDFNSNSIWDSNYRKYGSHSALVQYLDIFGIVSAYHVLNGEECGKESVPTFYLYRHRERPYHLDYCFLSQELVKCVADFSIGSPDSWLRYSDHLPLLLTLE